MKFYRNSLRFYEKIGEINAKKCKTGGDELTRVGFETGTSGASSQRRGNKATPPPSSAIEGGEKLVRIHICADPEGGE
jgi:hypothetical protein